MKDTIYSSIYIKVTTKPMILWLPTWSPCLSILRHTKVNLSWKLQNGYLCSKSPYNAWQTLEHWVRHVCLRTVSLLFDFVTKNLHLATIFYHLVAKWRLNDFVNFEPWVTVRTHCTDKICLALPKFSTKFVSTKFSICQAHWYTAKYLLTIACSLFAGNVTWDLRSHL